ncbi:metallophosphoesterase [Aurantiacibacter marinus]|uniref:Metallophosphoesterase n=1 Tax=Aurantiacibacter marinus TaxID=874156 RepID=A0A0H0XW30_9SPHN|nr:metallophosphoesterase [Aurantiacibacter marinus]KLI64495.1 metallophosphoesterase [Aurantiacibacter marinus]
MLIAQMTDIHIGFEPDARPEELNRTRFRATLDRLLAQPNTPDLLLVTGDITDRGDRNSFTRTAEMLAECPFPVKALVGNHDSREELLRAFPGTATDEHGFIQSAFVQDGLLVVSLDTFEPGRHGGAFCTKRRDWLMTVLEEHSDTPAVIFMHHPPVVSGIAWMDPDPSEQWIANLAAALEGRADQVQAIHCGHLHRQLNARFCGIPVSVTPSVAPLVSMDLRSISSDIPDSRSLITTEPPTYALHRWDGTNIVSHYERVCDWETIAYYSPHLQPMIREMEAEKGTG